MPLSTPEKLFPQGGSGAAAVALAERGFVVLPGRERESIGRNGKRHPRKSPYFHPRDLPHGVHSASRDQGLIERWYRRWPNGMLLLPTGEQVLALDLDRPGPAHDNLKGNGGFDFCSEGNLKKLTPIIIETASNGRIGLFAGRPLMRSFTFIPGAELKASGSYVAAPPSRILDGPFAGSAYRWTGPSLLDVPLPPLAPWLFPPPPEARPETEADFTDEPLELAVERARLALALLPNDAGHFDAYDDYFRIIFSVHAATRGDPRGLAAAIEWTRGWPGWSPGDDDNVTLMWEWLDDVGGPREISGGTLYKHVFNYVPDFWELWDARFEEIMEPYWNEEEATDEEMTQMLKK